MVTHHLGDITAWAFVWKQRRREVKLEFAKSSAEFRPIRCEFDLNFSSTLLPDKSPHSYVPQVVLECSVQVFLPMQRLNSFPGSRHIQLFGAKWRVWRLIGVGSGVIIFQLL